MIKYGFSLFLAEFMASAGFGYTFVQTHSILRRFFVKYQVLSTQGSPNLPDMGPQF